jgi:hypothetical protein
MIRNIFERFYDITTKEVKWWAFLGWTLPLVALSGVFFVWLYGTEDMLHRALVIGSITFFSISVYWWWWAINKLLNISRLMFETANGIKDISKDLRQIHSDIKPKDK